MELANRFEGFDREQLTAGWRVYSDLAYKKAWSLVEMLPCDSLKTAYLIAQEDRNKGKAHIVVPVPGHRSLCVEDFSSFADQIVLPRAEGIELSLQDGVVLAIVDGDATVVYYRVENGIVPPDEKVSEAIASSEAVEAAKPRRRRQRGQKRKFPVGRTDEIRTKECE